MPADLDFDSYLAFATGAGSAAMTQADWENIFSHLLLDGVLAGVPSGTTPASTELQAYGDSTGLQVKVRAGRVLIDGHLGRSTAEKTLSIATPHATLGRLDLVVARLDRTNSKLQLGVVTGTASASPAVPAVTDNSTTREIPLAVVTVAAAGTTIAAVDVADRRQFAVPDLRGLPSVRIRRTTDQGIANNAETAISFDASGLAHDTGAFWSAADPTKFYARRAGIYDAFGCVRWQTSPDNIRRLSVIKNGSTTMWRVDQPAVAAAETVQQISAKGLALAAGDYLTLSAYQNSGGSRNAEAASSYSPLFAIDLTRTR